MYRTTFVLGVLSLFYACTPDYTVSEQPDVENPLDDPDFEGGGVTGRVCAPAEHVWVAGADVWIEHDYGTASTQTDTDGYFTLTGVPAGTYTVNIQKGAFQTELSVEIIDGELTVLSEDTCLQDEDVQIAVVTGMYDSIEHVLDRLGIEYDLVYGDWGPDATTFLTDPARLDQYDIIFFNCGMSEDWIYTHESVVAQNLRDYVANGGAFYASDWAYYTVEASHPQKFDFFGDDTDSEGAKIGEEGLVTATVKDADIASALGSATASINYDLPIWAGMQASSNPSYVMLEGVVSTGDYWGNTQTLNAPLAAKSNDAGGTVLFTSFHNEAQSTSDMDVILQEIIFDL